MSVNNFNKKSRVKNSNKLDNENLELGTKDESPVHFALTLKDTKIKKSTTIPDPTMWSYWLTPISSVH